MSGKIRPGCEIRISTYRTLAPFQFLTLFVACDYRQQIKPKMYCAEFSTKPAPIVACCGVHTLGPQRPSALPCRYECRLPSAHVDGFLP